ncbi:hypothetical protein P7C73_g3531, partial [Tremellales sp. Uapishka_1]
MCESQKLGSAKATEAPIIISDDDEMEEVAVDIRREANRAGNGNVSDWKAREALKVALAQLDSEIQSVDDELRPLVDLRATLVANRRGLEAQILSLSTSQPALPHHSVASSSSSKGIDYQSPSSAFPWTASIMANLAKVFHLKSLRLCQEGVINASMDGRDIVCVMPTGGGKSLTYQLPAILGGGRKGGLTVVISPLLALIWDQVRGLREVGVECVMLTGSTSKEEQNEAFRRMERGAEHGEKDIKLSKLLVEWKSDKSAARQPEKIAKSKRFMSVLEKVNSAGRLTRFVIDYKKLSVLKTLFPRVPIQAVTATLSSKTLPDLLKILRLPPITDGRTANNSGTIFFSAPLYRPNLHYKVLVKPSNAKAAIESIGAWITDNHLGESGIIYCLSKKDTETVADALRERSNGAIKTGVYHAGIEDYDKEKIHVNWRKGTINVICATIAFGLGIDKGDVRYVIHHSMSKSLEGYYQETGRAGRDGKDSDCVLFYRGQDASRLSSLVYSDVDGSSKLQEMLRFAQDLRTCRKVAFAKYFSASSHLSTSAWDHSDSLSSRSTSVVLCGVCDNCTRPAESIIDKDVTLESWKIIKILEKVKYQDGRVTLGTFSDLIRGLGGGTFGTGGRKGDKGKVDLVEVGGKVGLNKEDTEALLIHLILLGYIEESYHATSYAVNVYLIPSSTAIRLSRLSQRVVEDGIANKINCTFPSLPGKKRKAKSRKKGGEDEEDEDEEADGDGSEVADKTEKSANRSKKQKAGPTTKRRVREKAKTVAVEEEDEYEDFDMEMMAFNEDSEAETEIENGDWEVEGGRHVKGRGVISICDDE